MIHATGSFIWTLLEKVLKWAFVAVAAIVCVLLIGSGIYALWTGIAPAVATTVVNIGETLSAFGVPSVADLAGNVIVGAVVGLVVGVLRFQHRRHSALAERVVEILGDPDLLSIRKLGVATVIGHMVAGVAAGALLAWVGFPHPNLTGPMTAFRPTPLVRWVIPESGGFGGGPQFEFALTSWAALLWFAGTVLILCAVATSAALVGATLVASIVSGAVFSAARSTTLTLALALAPALPDSPFRNGQVFMPERVYNTLSRDDGRRFMLRGAIVSGAATGLLTTALIMIWTTVTILR